MGVSKVIEVPFTLELPVGPQHPALHEPLLLKAYADGEEIVRVDVNTGYNHRGIEKLCERNSFYKDIFIVGRVCGICNAVHTNVYVRALEAILGVTPNRRAKYLRVLAMELERIHSHMLINAVMAENIGFENLFMNIMLDRERVMKAKEIVTGGRVLADYMMVGGVRRDIDDVKRDRLRKLLTELKPRVEYYRKVFEEDETILKRLVGVGRLKPVDVTSHGLLGPVARASGVKIDARASDKYDAYDEVSFNVVTRTEGDSWARMMVRWDETLESIEMALFILDKLPSDGSPVPDEKKLPRKFPPGEAYTRVEAQRGELAYYVMSDGKGMNPYRVKIRTPSVNNIINTGFLYVGYTIPDLPVILTSLDPCVSCMERVTVVDLEKNSVYRVSMKELSGGGKWVSRRYSV
ncbi:NADH-quinone oxidoreductase subunit D [Desulfurococcus mucosus]|uniref:NADH-ubiquinone oxidoreductase chain 49kDa n=1 Tax=Desulfurococcus mucosus (strain ATCC 35584 / DSM 2162 / JCM 9187 / O7/1) TaxID=765177 RepID=E8R9E4_DESM0|nr:NADH-quinone oxidoreductase subunit D [Desulfurococcus mucosus]ADV65120.1 NADH-ubiquinone oxidoreductase chain 49kDa [Desulfurococcus mucosus DSM 2162]